MLPPSEMREEGGAQVVFGWNSCGGLGGSARFIMVLRGVRRPSLIVVEFDHFKK